MMVTSSSFVALDHQIDDPLFEFVQRIGALALDHHAEQTFLIEQGLGACHRNQHQVVHVHAQRLALDIQGSDHPEAAIAGLDPLA